MPKSSTPLPDPAPTRAEKFAEAAYPALRFGGPALAAIGALGGVASIVLGFDLQAPILFLILTGLGFVAMGAHRFLSFRPLGGIVMTLFGAAVIAVELFFLFH